LLPIAIGIARNKTSPKEGLAPYCLIKISKTKTSRLRAFAAKHTKTTQNRQNSNSMKKTLCFKNRQTSVLQKRLKLYKKKACKCK